MEPLRRALRAIKELFLMFLFLLWQAEVQKELEQLCSVLGSLKDECETLLTDFFPEFWDAIVNKLVSY